MTTRRQQIIDRAKELLRAGILASNIPGRLMEEFNITPAEARELAGAAIQQYKQADRKQGPSGT